MQFERRVEFDSNSLLKLLTHYSEGVGVPLDAQLVSISASEKLPRWIALVVEAKEWEDVPFETGDGYGGQQPIMLRYEGKRVMTLQHMKDPISWSDENAIEAPRRL